MTNIDQKVETIVETVPIPIHDADDSKVVRIGAKLNAPLQNKLQKFFKEYADVFVWIHDDMGGISPNISSHQQNVQPHFKPISQWQLLFNQE